ncbi:hypothetical protein phytr_11080 [Candidatus Phycorickettsia trachydisci]|uniref:Uncharacterized protein n=1 Tax=Candidatus Phycorickettsia trachydisci TaxID=2115978 RepID=A0A2P1P9T8_9RICK|nr:hypothetical protein [Candidatus Phycorickettsia trachydisci]AVP88033.1 hypothetical protein phytr_11080 [Candidatus Phycorickettsia trachydisci]
MQISRIQYAFINDQAEIKEVIDLTKLINRKGQLDTITYILTKIFKEFFFLEINYKYGGRNGHLQLENYREKAVLTLYSSGYTLDQARKYIELANLVISKLEYKEFFPNFKESLPVSLYIEIGAKLISQGKDLNLQTSSIHLMTAILEYDKERVNKLKRAGAKLDIDLYEIYSKLPTILEYDSIRKLFQDVITKQIIEEFENQRLENLKTLVQSREILLKLKPLKDIIQPMEKLIMQHIQQREYLHKDR